MVPLNSLLLTVSASFSLILGASDRYKLQYTLTGPDLRSCSLQPSIFSCENTTIINNSCCSPTPGGLVLQTQFWDTYTGYEAEGQALPEGSWTIHGLWPDNCDGYE